MPVFEKQSRMPVTPEALWEWHARPGALERLLPPWDGSRVLSQAGGMADREVVMSVVTGPVRRRVVARHVAADPPRSFRDRMVEGPFTRWEHTHRFEPADEGSLLVDHVDYALPGGAVGEGLAGDAVERRLARTFHFRHQRTREDLDTHAGRAAMRVAVTGATGLLGTELVAMLRGGGHRVDRVVRRPPEAGTTDLRWDPAKGAIDAASLDGVDAVVNLAGESVFGRWTEAKKAEILRSRVEGTKLLAGALAKLPRKPKVLVSASAIGFYGDRGDEPVDESAPAGADFLGGVCHAWEEATRAAEDAGIRVVHARVGVVMSARGGALGTMLPVFRAGLGGPLGSGLQVMSWVALDDVLRALHHALYAELRGPVNLTAPNAVPQVELAKTLGDVLGRPTFLSAPAFALRAALGEAAGTLLGGQRVLPTRLLESGFRFLRPGLREALEFELGRFALA